MVEFKQIQLWRLKAFWTVLLWSDWANVDIENLIKPEIKRKWLLLVHDRSKGAFKIQAPYNNNENFKF